jgi:hypothetical protein
MVPLRSLLQIRESSEVQRKEGKSIERRGLRGTLVPLKLI